MFRIEGPLVMLVSSKFINIISVIYIAIVALIAVVSYWLVIPPPLLELPTSNLDKPANAALSLSVDVVKLLLTLATGLISVCVWLLTRPLMGSRELIERTVWVALALSAFCLSLYFGFIGLQRIVIMISLRGFDPRLDMVWWPQLLQYYSFVVGAIILGLGCIRSFNTITERQE